MISTAALKLAPLPVQWLPKSVRTHALLCLAVKLKSTLYTLYMHTLDTCSWPYGAGCGVFGRDEGGSAFSFTAHHVETL